MRAGQPAPWERLEPAGRRGLSLQRVLEALVGAGQDGSLPASVIGPAGGGWEGLLLDGRVQGIEPLFAVLVALFEVDGEARTVLTRRSADLRSHRGQVAFPGGRLEPGELPVEAALREASEEVALDPGLVEPVGWLHPLRTATVEWLVVPLVAGLARPPRLVPNPAEVARVFDVALADLVAPGVFHEEWWDVQGRPTFPVWFFELDGETVWGATARMLMELLCLALELPPPPVDAR